MMNVYFLILFLQLGVAQAGLVTQPYSYYEVLNLTSTSLEVRKVASTKNKNLKKQKVIILNRNKVDPNGEIRPDETIPLTRSALRKSFIKKK